MSTRKRRHLSLRTPSAFPLWTKRADEYVPLPLSVLYRNPIEMIHSIPKNHYRPSILTCQNQNTTGFGSFFNIFELKEEFRAEDNCNGRWNARRVVSNNRRDVGHAAEASGQNVALNIRKGMPICFEGERRRETRSISGCCCCADAGSIDCVRATIASARFLYTCVTPNWQFLSSRHPLSAADGVTGAARSLSLAFFTLITTENYKERGK